MGSTSTTHLLSIPYQEHGNTPNGIDEKQYEKLDEKHASALIGSNKGDGNKSCNGTDSISIDRLKN
jgi:hypothetical protein